MCALTFLFNIKWHTKKHLKEIHVFKTCREGVGSLGHFLKSAVSFLLENKIQVRNSLFEHG